MEEIMAVEDWIKMGYSDEEAEKLNEISIIGARMYDIYIDDMTQALQGLMEQSKEYYEVKDD